MKPTVARIVGKCWANAGRFAHNLGALSNNLSFLRVVDVRTVKSGKNTRELRVQRKRSEREKVAGERHVTCDNCENGKA